MNEINDDIRKSEKGRVTGGGGVIRINRDTVNQHGPKLGPTDTKKKSSASIGSSIADVRADYNEVDYNADQRLKSITFDLYERMEKDR